MEIEPGFRLGVRRNIEGLDKITPLQPEPRDTMSEEKGGNFYGVVQGQPNDKAGRAGGSFRILTYVVF